MKALDPSRMSTGTRRRFADLIHRSWTWISLVGGISPDDNRGARFAHLGPGSLLAFPPGTLFGEQWISIGSDTLIGPQVNLSVGMLPDEPYTPPTDEPVLQIGDRCNIGRGSSVAARASIRIGDDVTTGPDVYVTDHNHDFRDVTTPITRQWPQSAAVAIGRGSWLGAGAVVLPGTQLGKNVVVGAGSVVRGVIPDYSVAVGAPARVVRQWTADRGWWPPLDDDAEESPYGDWPWF